MVVTQLYSILKKIHLLFVLHIEKRTVSAETVPFFVNVGIFNRSVNVARRQLVTELFVKRSESCFKAVDRDIIFKIFLSFKIFKFTA